MKIKFLLCSLFSLFANFLLAQINDVPPAPEMEPIVVEAPPMHDDKTFELFDIEKEPSFPGGTEEMYIFLSQNIVYPDSARANGVQGSVVAIFVINADGSISNATIVKDIGMGCGKEVLRVLRLMPAWIPGEANGRPVKVRYTLPVRFRFD